MSHKLFSLKDAGKTLKINTIWLVARATDGGSYTIEMTPPLPPPPPPNVNVRSLPQISAFGDLHFNENTDVAGLGVEVVPGDPPVAWRLRMRNPLANDLLTLANGEKEVSDLIMVLGYEWE
jgi:hypothetical protein